MTKSSTHGDGVEKEASRRRLLGEDIRRRQVNGGQKRLGRCVCNTTTSTPGVRDVRRGDQNRVPRTWWGGRGGSRYISPWRFPRTRHGPRSARYVPVDVWDSGMPRWSPRGARQWTRQGEGLFGLRGDCAPQRRPGSHRRDSESHIRSAHSSVQPAFSSMH